MSDPYIGEIRMFPGLFAPSGWLYCDGSVQQIANYGALYTLVGTTYGGDGQTTFNLPDLRGRVPVHVGPGYVLGQVSGSETVTLTGDQLPAHPHNYGVSSGEGGEATPNNAVLATSSGGSLYDTATPTATMNAASILPAGGSAPHNNMMPFLTIAFIICTEGQFPPRPN